MIMKLKAFAVMDLKAGFFSNPWFDLTESMAMRGFSDMVMDNSNPNNLWAKHPEDFALYHIGSFETDNGSLDKLLVLQCLLTASAVKASRGSPEIPNLNGVVKEPAIN